MGNWWEDAPLVAQPKAQGNWWGDAPLAAGDNQSPLALSDLAPIQVPSNADRNPSFSNAGLIAGGNGIIPSAVPQLGGAQGSDERPRGTPRTISYEQWKSLSRAERRELGLPLSQIGGGLKFGQLFGLPEYDARAPGDGRPAEFVARPVQYPAIDAVADAASSARDYYTYSANPEGYASLDEATVPNDPVHDFLIGADNAPGRLGSSLGTWLNRAGESATLGMVGDEASAAATGMLPGRSYESELERYRGNEDNMSTMGRLSADVAGAVAPGLAGLGIVARGVTRGAQAAWAAALGAGAGGLFGVMEGEGASDRLMGGATGAAFGGAIGAATPALAGLAKNAWRNVAESRAGKRIVKDVAGQFSISRKAGGLLDDVVGMDDAARMRQALSSPDAMLADAGPSTQGALDAVIQSPGEGARTAMRRIDDRAARAGSNLSRTLDDTLTGSQIASPGGRQFSDTARMQGDVRAATAPARRAMYERAYSQPIDYSSPQGAALLDGVTPRLPSEAVNYANRLMRLNGEKSPQIMASIAEDGTVTFTNPPDVRQWDYIKQALDGLAESGDGAGALGGQTRLGSAYQGLAREVRRNLGEAVPDYDYAVSRAGDIIGEVKAIKTGDQLLNARVTRAEAEASLEGMSAIERAAVKRGLRQSIDDKLAQVRAVISDPNVDLRQAQKAYADLSSRSARDKMKMLLGGDWPKVETALDDASRALGLRARVATNSRTFQRQQFGQMMDDSLAPGPLASGEWIDGMATMTNPVKGALRAVTGASQKSINKAGAKARNELADVLTRPGAQQALDAIAQIRNNNAIPKNAGNALQQLLMLNLIGNSGRLGDATGSLMRRLPGS